MAIRSQADAARVRRATSTHRNVTYDEVPELHFITPVTNLPSILEHGILSNKRAARLSEARSIARQDIQDQRAKIRVPGGRPLHDYANLYFHARNPMMYLRKGQHAEICVVAVSKQVLTLADVIVTDQNAASEYVRFFPSPDGLRYLDREWIYADDWRHDSQRDYYRHRSVKCAEALVPDWVRPEAVRGIYVSCQAAHDRVVALVPEGTAVKTSPVLFFQA